MVHTITSKKFKITRYSLNKALEHSNVELASFFNYAGIAGTERALIEFSARVCYKSTAKLGSSPNFVQKVLESGHLSVAEHPSLGIPGQALRRQTPSSSSAKIELWMVNKYFDFTATYIIGNLRCWIDYTRSKLNYFNEVEPLLTILPDIFETQSLEPIHVVEMDSFRSYINVPIMSGESGLSVALLGANLDDTFFQRSAGKFARFTWLVEGISRNATHQIARHRGASISQESQRYVDARNDARFIYPPSFTDTQRHILQAQYEAAMEQYVKLRESGAKKEDARFLLPSGIETRLVLSFNLKELIHFLKVRCAKDAQWEIRDMAKLMAKQAFLATGNKELGEIVEWTES